MDEQKPLLTGPTTMQRKAFGGENLEEREERAPEKLRAALESDQSGSSTSSAPDSLCDLQQVA